MQVPIPNPEHRIASELIRVCKQVLGSIIVDPKVEVEDVSVNCIHSSRFDSFEERLIFIVSVQTNDAAVIRGDSNLYKGSYKERVEGVLDFCAKAIIPDCEVHLEIKGPNIGPVERFVGVDDLIRSGRLSQRSPIVNTARQFAIPDILIRGRHIIAPSPAIATYLEDLLRRDVIRTAVDLFGGTGLMAKVLCGRGNAERITVVERKASHLQRMKHHVQDPRVEFVKADAFRYQISRCDLVVADPYYEDAVKFLRKRMNTVLQSARVFIFVSGRIEDVGWNETVEQTLRGTGARVQKWHGFGQVLFEVRI